MTSYLLSRPILPIFLLAAALLLATTGCDGRADSGASSAPSASPQDSADCTPRSPNRSDQTGESDPRVLRGQVLAPFGKLAKFSPPTAPASPAQPARSPFPQWVVPSAEAAPLEAERTVANARVHLYQVDARGERRGEVIAKTRSDSGGNWCIRLPDGISPGPGLMVEARGAGDATRLRRSVVAPFATDTFVGTEALTRLLQANKVDFSRIATETFINMESIADTRMDLLDPVELTSTMSLEDAVTHIQQTLAKDPRLAEKMASAPKSP